MQLHIKYLTDSVGEKTAVQIPFEEWKKLADYYKHLQQCDNLKTPFTDAFKEISEIEKGHIRKYQHTETQVHKFSVNSSAQNIRVAHSGT